MNEPELKIKLVLESSQASTKKAVDQMNRDLKGATSGSGLTSLSSSEMASKIRSEQAASAIAANRAYRQRVAFQAGVQQYSQPIGPNQPNSITSMFQTMVNKPLTTLQSGLLKFGAATVGISFAMNYLEKVASLAGRALDVFVRAAENASRLYAKQLTSGGLPGEFIAKRSLLANAIGVGENEVLRYGKAVEYLSKEMNFASGVFARTTPNLAALHWHMKVVESDFKAITAVIANEFAPALSKLLNAFHLGTASFGELIGKAVATAIKGGLQSFFGPTNSALSKLFLKMIPDKGPAPGMDVGANRYSVSPWERMGLVLGNATSSPASLTARNTTRMVVQMDGLLNYVRGGGSGPNRGTNGLANNP